MPENFPLIFNDESVLIYTINNEKIKISNFKSIRLLN